MILDIETTGLSPKDSEVILVGIIYYKNNQWWITQIFCDHHKEERQLLIKLMDYLDNHLIITYNGHAFDLPYLNKRYKHHKLDYEISLAKHFDLYRVVRASKKALNLPNYKLKTIEEYLGIFREDQISGKDSVMLYKNYEENPSIALRNTILLHNSDDIAYMIPTMNILNTVPSDIIDRFYPFEYQSSRNLFILTSYDHKTDFISITCNSERKLTSYADYRDGFTLEKKMNTLKVTVPIFKIGERSFIDVDQLPFPHTSFNDMALEDQLDLELTNKFESFSKILKLLDRYI